jgi:hypothetical protein
MAAGVYAIYYNGPFKTYAPLVEQNLAAASRGRTQIPIYIGKAVPAGTRKGARHSAVPDFESRPK